jgi:exodeoxyribonuclease VII small subunit
MAQKKSPTSFANTLEELEALASRLEDNDTPLEQSLKDFESGVALIRQAQKSLLEAEQKVKLLLEQNGEPVATPLVDTGAGDDKDGL